MAKKDPDKLARLTKSNHTIKTSLLEDALKVEAITDEKFIDSTFGVIVETGRTLHKDGRLVPVLICVGEGSQRDLTTRLAVFVGKDPERSADVEIISQCDREGERRSTRITH